MKAVKQDNDEKEKESNNKHYWGRTTTLNE